MIDTSKLDSGHCLICLKQSGKIRNKTLYAHIDEETNELWFYCNRCGRGYSLYEYCSMSGISVREFLKKDFDFRESKPNEVSKMEWPSTFVSLTEKIAEPGLEYLESRGIKPDTNMYYDTWRKGIVFPYYYGNIFCGAQIRMIKEWTDEHGETHKVATLTGTRLGLLIYNYKQESIDSNIKGVIVTEGAFNSLAIQQSLDAVYGGRAKNPWLAVALSGSGITDHQLEILKDIKESGRKVVASLDSDEAGVKGLKKLKDNNCITNYSITGDTKLDWNDILMDLGNKNLAKEYLKGMKKI